MAILNSGNTGEMEQGSQGLRVVLAMNDVGHDSDICQLIGDRNGRLMQFFGYVAEDGAITDGLMAVAQQFARNVENIQLRAGSRCQRTIGEKDPQDIANTGLRFKLRDRYIILWLNTQIVR